MEQKMYTRAGDQGKTRYCNGQQVGKEDVRIQAYGEIDELNSFTGWALSSAGEFEGIQEILEKIQNQLFIASAELANPEESKHKILDKHVQELENICDSIGTEVGELTKFILPQGTELSTRMQVCRTVCRRVERKIVELNEKEKLNSELLKYINRLSSVFFQLARLANHRKKIAEKNPTYL
ncbi:MAG: cob(I)yrinic acid a,c-diamide adenosyltransferase [Candidatus Diapherotrites archaeon]|nr:cob(I)yrinic acid a,c-diamide adenosyltransferase [Candidatus Diapherotrites archaeon]